MSEDTSRTAALWTVLAIGTVLYLLTHVWVPSTLVVGPVQLGDGAGDCHGFADRVSGTRYLEVCANP